MGCIIFDTVGLITGAAYVSQKVKVLIGSTEEAKAAAKAAEEGITKFLEESKEVLSVIH